MGRHARSCPWCGLLIVTDDATRTISHLAPECQRFAEEVRARNPDQTFVEIVDVPGGETCACAAIRAGRSGFCRDHRRAFIQEGEDMTTGDLIEALAKHAGIALESGAPKLH